jgi:hypothetical protein
MCVGERGSLMTDWGRMAGEGEGWGKRGDQRGQNNFGGRRAMDFSTGGGRVKGMRIGLRG